MSEEPEVAVFAEPVLAPAVDPACGGVVTAPVADGETAVVPPPFVAPCSRADEALAVQPATKIARHNSTAAGKNRRAERISSHRPSAMVAARMGVSAGAHSTHARSSEYLRPRGGEDPSTPS